MHACSFKIVAIIYNEKNSKVHWHLASYIAVARLTYSQTDFSLMSGVGTLYIKEKSGLHGYTGD